MGAEQWQCDVVGGREVGLCGEKGELRHRCVRRAHVRRGRGWGCVRGGAGDVDGEGVLVDLQEGAEEMLRGGDGGEEGGERGGGLHATA